MFREVVSWQQGGGLHSFRSVIMVGRMRRSLLKSATWLLILESDLKIGVAVDCEKVAGAREQNVEATGPTWRGGS